MSFVVCILKKKGKGHMYTRSGRGRGTSRGRPVSGLVRRRPQKSLESNTGIVNRETMVKSGLGQRPKNQLRTFSGKKFEYYEPSPAHAN